MFFNLYFLNRSTCAFHFQLKESEMKSEMIDGISIQATVNGFTNASSFATGPV